MEAFKVKRKRRARVYIETLASVLSDEQRMANIIPMGSPQEAAALTAERQIAAAMFRQYQLNFLARLGPGARI